jgi:hemolysin III
VAAVRGVDPPVDRSGLAGNGYSRAEEVAHCATHALGLVASLVAIVWLVGAALGSGAGAWRASGGAIFGTSALLLFTTSVLYHATSSPRLRPRLRLLDHAAIYVLIAGTYTPFALGVLGGAWGWTLFGLVWGLAMAGIAAKMTFGFRFPLASTLLYLAMGWIGVVAARPLLASLTTTEITWIVAGGLAYTAGVPFYLWKSRRYTHAVWHLFVLAGVACHFVAVLSVMAPRDG